MSDKCRERSLIDEDVLIERVKAGGSELFEQLIEPYKRKMYFLAYSVLRNEHDAEDVVQESALKAFTRLNQLRSSTAFKCWLLQITINEARMRKRHERLYPCSSIDEEQRNTQDGSGVVELADRRENPEQALERGELEAALTRAWDDLPNKYRSVLRLRCAQDRNILEIAGALRLSVPAVKTRLHRARLQLRQRLLPVLPADRDDGAAYTRMS